jgi:hypothetical protein
MNFQARALDIVIKARFCVRARRKRFLVLTSLNNAVRMPLIGDSRMNGILE